jgi:hypothetical protein
VTGLEVVVGEVPSMLRANGAGVAARSRLARRAPYAAVEDAHLKRGDV